jgi:hypothetical protein
MRKDVLKSISKSFLLLGQPWKGAVVQISEESAEVSSKGNKWKVMLPHPLRSAEGG